MKTQFTNSQGEYITVGQLVVRMATYSIAGLAALEMVYWLTVLTFCM